MRPVSSHNRPTNRTRLVSQIAALVGLGPLVLLSLIPMAGCRSDARGSESPADVVSRFQCHRCHQGVREGASPDCVACHQEYVAEEHARLGSRGYAHLMKKMVHLMSVPSLQGVGRRFRRNWFVAFLQEPCDLRPALEMSMPRLAVKPAEAELIADFFGVTEKTSEDPFPWGDPRKGAHLYELNRCKDCHPFSGNSLLRPGDPHGALEVRVQSPDLRFVRERMDPRTVLSLLDDPLRFKSGSKMPRFPFTYSERLDLTTFLFKAPLAPPEPPPVPARLPILKRRVHYDEVARQVFRRTCHHCHGKAGVMGKGGGPGNSGGFGFRRRGLAVGDYESISAGMLDSEGRRVSIFEPTADGVPLLVAALLTRYEEVAGRPNPALRGMPLAYPPVPIEDIQLVDTWVAQGHEE